MGDYCSFRIWQLKPGCSATDLEVLAASGLLEMQYWIAGVKHLSLTRLQGEPTGRYLLMITFQSYEAYTKWRQIEEEGPDYWERYASVLMHWEQLSALVEEYAGERLIDTEVQRLV